MADDLYHKADEAAAGRGLNRSQFYALAITSYLEQIEDDPVTRDIDAAIDSAGDDDLAEWTDAASRAAFARKG